MALLEFLRVSGFLPVPGDHDLVPIESPTCLVTTRALSSSLARSPSFGVRVLTRSSLCGFQIVSPADHWLTTPQLPDSSTSAVLKWSLFCAVAVSALCWNSSCPDPICC
jgi:hypothetical protein